jgi:hypothetical protein
MSLYVRFHQFILRLFICVDDGCSIYAVFTSKKGFDASSAVNSNESQQLDPQLRVVPESEKYVPRDVVDVDAILKRLTSARPVAETNAQSGKERFMVTRKQDIQVLIRFF